MIREATPDDVPVLLAMIGELAAYERAPESAQATEPQLAEALFGPQPAAFALLAEEAGAPVGYALWFRNFSTWTGTHGVYLEDLFVRPGARGGGHGRALLTALAQLCVTRGYQRFEWSVLDWNEPSLGFFQSVGARPMDEWRGFRLTGDALHSLAESTPSNGA
ncbi:MULTISPECIES: GNAT family N-acetyltransferase [unclassified Streptomyces]|uniref:GNAT family N-acetyltransferase n=1 Tax=unclassified Streptomyces TaxID=2593676 RepID=UPI00344B2D86